MRIKRIGAFGGIVSGLLLGGVALAISLSPTTITISQSVHFFAPDSTDIIVKPGNYEVKATGNTLRLQSADMKDPIHVQAGPSPYPEDVDSPVAMAIPIPDEGIYLALAVPNEADLEAMGSYSGIQTRGTNFLQRRKFLTAQQRTQLRAFALQLQKNPNAPNLPQQWKQITQQGKSQSQAPPPTDTNAMLIQVLRQSYLETNKDLQSLAAKIKANNETKKLLREQIQEAREKLSQATNAKDKETRKKIEEKLEQAIQDLVDQNSEAQFEIQALMSQYNQAQQAAARIQKKQDDAQSSALRKIIK